MSGRQRKRIEPGIDETVDQQLEVNTRKKRASRQKLMTRMLDDDPELKERFGKELEILEPGKEPWRKHIRPDVPYDPELGKAICDLVALGFSLRDACEQEGMPSSGAVSNWVVRVPEFGKQYSLACQAKAAVWADEIMDIADDARNDWMLRHRLDGTEYYELNGEHTRRTEMRISARKWYLSKIMPKQFGDATLLKLADAQGNQLPSQAPSITIIGISPPRPTDEEAE